MFSAMNGVQTSAAAKPQDVTTNKKSGVQRFRPRRAHGRQANMSADQDGTGKLAEEAMLSMAPVEGTWAKRVPTPTRNKAGEPKSKISKHNVALAPSSSHGSSNSPRALLDSPDQCNDVLQKLAEGSNEERNELLLWLCKALRQLALSKSGCRVVQKAIEVAGPAERELIIAELRDHIVELYESPYGNHVLSRAIETFPSAKNDFVISALLGRAVTVAKHRFGCRVICRLIEHCTEDQSGRCSFGDLLDEVLADADNLARHAFGNFVIQHALEHAPLRRADVLSKLLPDFSTLAMHRSGSLVAQRALDFCNAEGQLLAINALLQGGEQKSLPEVACSHYGSYVIEQLAAMRTQGEVQVIACILSSNMEQLLATDHGKRVLVAFGLTGGA